MPFMLIEGTKYGLEPVHRSTRTEEFALFFRTLPQARAYAEKRLKARGAFWLIVKTRLVARASG